MGLAIRYPEEEVQRVKAGHKPMVGIIKRVSFKKTFAQAEQEHRDKKLNIILPRSSPTYANAAQASEEAADRLTQSPVPLYDLEARTKTPTSVGENRPAVRNENSSSNHSYNVDGSFDQFSDQGRILERGGHDVRRSVSGSKIGEKYDYGTDENEDEDEDDNMMFAPKRQRMNEQVYTSDVES